MRRIWWISLLLCCATLSAYAQEAPTRTVVQTVFTTAGKPAAGAEVRASYVVRGHWILRQAVADAQARVTWTELPPAVRVITWGEGVPAGVIPADVTAVTAPLPAPQTEKSATVTIGLLGIKGMTHWRLCSPYHDLEQSGVLDPQRNHENIIHANLTEGTTFSLLAISCSTPPKSVYLRDAYVPYSDAPSPSLKLGVSLPQTGFSVSGKLVTRDGKPVPAISRFLLHPLSLDGLPAATVDVLVRGRAPLLLATFPEKGTFTVLAPAPGTYRLEVDLYQAAVEAPALTLSLKPGLKEVTVTLPDPLATVPAGTVFHWVPAGNPAITETFSVRALAPEMPLFAPRNAMLAAWYAPTPGTMKVWTPEGKASWTTRALRTVNLHPVDKDGKPFTAGSPDEEAVLYSCFPCERAPAAIRLDGAPYTRMNLWPGSYLVAGADLAGGWTRLEIPVDGPVDIPVRIDFQPQSPRPNLSSSSNYERCIIAKLPAADYAALQKQWHSYTLHLEFDVPEQHHRQIKPQTPSTIIHFNVPEGATKMTLCWPGIGVIRDVPLPREDTTDANPLQLPAWQPGVTLTGRLVEAGGKPLANRQLICVLAYYARTAVLGSTDADGKFSLSGLLPGTLFVQTAREQWGGWTVQLPEGGVTDLTLDTSASRIGMRWMAADIANAQPLCWWVPHTGKPRRLPVRGSESFSYDTLPMPGYFWMVDTANNDNLLVPFVANMPAKNEATDAAPAVTFVFSWTPAQPLPRGIRLVGIGEQEGLDVTFDKLSWSPGIVTGTASVQISCVPPGTYLAHIDTPRGRVDAPLTVTAQGAVVHLQYPAR